MTKVVQNEMSDSEGPGKHRELHHFCQHRDCMRMDAEHFRSNRQDVKDTSFLTDKGVFSYRTIPNHETIRGSVKTFREFSRYVTSMADKKAVGKDKMPADLFKRAPEEFRRRAWSLINKILAGEYTCSPDVLEAKVIPSLLCKDATSRDLLGNYRLIALCNAFYHLLNSIITGRLRHLTEKYAVLEASQFGFRNARAVQLVIQKAKWLTRQAIKADFLSLALPLSLASLSLSCSFSLHLSLSLHRSPSLSLFLALSISRSRSLSLALSSSLSSSLSLSL